MTTVKEIKVAIQSLSSDDFTHLQKWIIELDLKQQNQEIEADSNFGKKVKIYTDGACIQNPGPGGYGIIVSCNEYREELSGGYSYTTNNRMELMAAIQGLKALNFPSEVELYSDSQYLINTMTKNWKRKANNDLWQELDELCSQHQVEFFWVKGHSGHPENERCDFLAGEAAKQSNLPSDFGYQNL